MNLMKCPNLECGDIIKKNILQKHLDECAHQILKCENCELDIVRHNIENHVESSKCYLIQNEKLKLQNRLFKEQLVKISESCVYNDRYGEVIDFEKHIPDSDFVIQRTLTYYNGCQHAANKKIPTDQMFLNGVTKYLSDNLKPSEYIINIYQHLHYYRDSEIWPVVPTQDTRIRSGYRQTPRLRFCDPSSLSKPRGHRHWPGPPFEAQARALSSAQSDPGDLSQTAPPSLAPCGSTGRP